MKYNYRCSMAKAKMFKAESPIFALALTISKILAFPKFDIEQVGQCHGVKLSQLCHSIANMKSIKVIFYFFQDTTIAQRKSHTHTRTHARTRMHTRTHTNTHVAFEPIE